MIFGGVLLFLIGCVDGLALSCVEPDQTGMAASLLNTKING